MYLLTYLAVFWTLILAGTAQVNNCAVLAELEYALYNTDSNKQQLNHAFFPPRKATSRYIMVIYDFMDGNGESNGCNVTYIWAIGGFLLIQPPTLFQFLSLLFNFPANDVSDITIKLPNQCRHLISIDSNNSSCSCKDHEDSNLDIITQQIMQYSKFVNYSEVVRDEKSVAQSICFEDIESRHFDGVNVTLFLSASLILPVAVTILSLVAVLKYYREIEREIKNPNTRPSVIGAVMTGLYVTIYMLCMDITAIYMYASGGHEYDNITNEPLSLRWSYATLIVECSMSVFAVWIILACTTPKLYLLYYRFFRKITTFKNQYFTLLTTILMLQILLVIPVLLVSFIYVLITVFTVVSFVLSILLIPFIFYFTFYSFISNQLMISLLIVTIIFASAHVDYIFAAWLTEPSKTTSVAIMALTIILFLFVMSRTLYRSIRSFWSEWFFQCCYSKHNDMVEGFLLTVTIFLGLFGVAIISLHIAAFFILPIPTVSLADYLENIVQISLVILACLITYKIISIHESDTSKILKRLTQRNNPTSQSSGNKEVESLNNLSVLLKLNGELNTYPIQISWDSVGQKTAAILLQKASFSVLHDRQKEVFILTSQVLLCIPSFHFTKEEVHISLDKAKLKVILGDDKHTTVNISLKKAKLRVGTEEYPASQMELRLVLPKDDTKSRGTITVAKSMMTLHDDFISKIDSFIIPGYVIKTSEAKSYLGLYIRFDNSLTFRDNNKCYVLTDTTTLQMNDKGFGPQLQNPPSIIRHETTHLVYIPKTLKGHALTYHLNIKNGAITLAYTEASKIKITTEGNVSVNTSPDMFELRFKYNCILFPSIEIEESINIGQSIKHVSRLWCLKCWHEHKMTMSEKKNEQNKFILSLFLDGENIYNIELGQNIQSKIKIKGFKESYLNIGMKNSIMIGCPGQAHENSIEISQDSLPLDVIFQPKLSTSCDTSFLYFPAYED